MTMKIFRDEFLNFSSHNETYTGLQLCNETEVIE
jgi:hypothetical protein